MMLSYFDFEFFDFEFFAFGDLRWHVDARNYVFLYSNVSLKNWCKLLLLLKTSAFQILMTF